MNRTLIEDVFSTRKKFSLYSCMDIVRSLMFYILTHDLDYVSEHSVKILTSERTFDEFIQRSCVILCEFMNSKDFSSSVYYFKQKYPSIFLQDKIEMNLNQEKIENGHTEVKAVLQEIFPTLIYLSQQSFQKVEEHFARQLFSPKSKI